MRRVDAFRILLLTTSVAALCAGHASAADTAAVSASGGGAQVEELVVTAQKREEKLQDVPMSVNAISGTQLAAKGITQVADLDKVVPGFTFRPSNFGTPVYTIRGVGFFENTVTVAPAVSVYVDQIPLPYSVMTEGASVDLERVEVLKGPQGTLFGQNATGGAINYIAAKPTSSFAAGGNVGYGNFNAFHADGFVSGPVSDRVTARLALSTDQRGDWQRSVSRDDSLGRRNFTDGRLVVDWRPSDTVFIEANFNGWIDKSDSQAAQFVAFRAIKPTGYKDVVPLFAALTPAPNNDRAADWDANTSLRRNDNFYQGSLHADWDITPDVKLTSLTAYSGLHQVAPSDSDGTPIVNQLRHLHTDIHSFYQELRLSGTTDQDRLKWMVGLNYGKDRDRDRQFTNTDATNDGIGALRWFDYRVRNDQDVETKAVFGSVDYKLTPTLTGQASVRYTSSDNRFTGCLQDAGDGQLAAAFSQIASHPITAGSCVTLTPPPASTPVAIVQKSLNENNVSWRLGLSWKPAPDQMVYLTVTKGYKAGSFPSVAALTPDQFDPIQQESVLAYEAGFKSTLLDRTLQLDAAVFYYDYRDKQLIGFKTTAFGNLPGFISIPKSQVPGAEVDVVWRPIEPLTVSLGASYVDSKVTSSLVTNDPFGNAESIDGEAFPNSPKWHLTGDVQYKAQLAQGWLWFAGAGAQYRSATTAAFAGGPLFNVRGYTLLDLRGGVESENGRWRVTAWGNNVTDQFYVTNVSHVVDAVARVTGMPATYGVTLGYRY
jgi:outer membrane receptor protein involved in Fe transport